ncbi:unnamed protein product [Rodentolepis nana]|uniref:Uncharacterized protein n=1 Tax=Rodentolepis nana TaxID=102285 RepID=A0A3P7RXR7_RODNA|nr:unnamed protein product [Rodentolepis nana]
MKINRGVIYSRLNRAHRFINISLLILLWCIFSIKALTSVKQLAHLSPFFNVPENTITSRAITIIKQQH